MEGVSKKNKIILFCIFFIEFSIIVYEVIYLNNYKKILDKENKCCEEVNVTYVNNVLNPNYVFLGDSIFDFYDLKNYYPDLPIVNSGIAGNYTEDILNNLESRVYVYNPSKVLLLIGINDLLYLDHDDAIAENIRQIVENINSKLPYCEIYVLSIYPMNEGWYVYVPSDEIIGINNQIKEYCENNNLQYVDIYSHLINSDNKLDGKYSDDGLHPNEAGYNLITDILNEKVFNKKEQN